MENVCPCHTSRKVICAVPGMCTPNLQHLSSNTAAICLFANQPVVEAVAQNVCPSIIYCTTFVRMCSSFVAWNSKLEVGLCAAMEGTLRIWLTRFRECQAFE